MRTDFTSMTGPELVVAFNDMATKAQAAGIDRFKPVTRFPTRDKGMARCSTLYLVLSREGKCPSAPPKAKPVVEAKAKPKANGHAKGTIFEEFNTREGTKRETLLRTLSKSLNKPVAEKTLLAAIYGSQSEENKGALSMVMKGLHVMIAKGKLPYTVVRSREGKEVYFELQTV